MEVAESREQTSVGPTTGAESTVTNGERNPFLDDPLMDDGRSSSLSEIDDVSDNEPSDFGDSPKPERQLENDSEAETERIEDSPHHIRKLDIVLSAGSAGPSPSKLHQSTTLADVDDEEPVADDSPSKPRRSSHNNGLTEENTELEDVELPDSIGKKRKRVELGDETGTEMGEEEEPLKKRRSSIKSDLSDPIDDDEPLSPEPIDEPLEAPIAVNDDEMPADEAPESELPAAPSKGKKGKNGKRKGRKAVDADEETGGGGVEAITEDVADDNLEEDEEPAERVDEPDDAEAAARVEEECKFRPWHLPSGTMLTPLSLAAKKMAAMESLATLEKEFATLRDKYELLAPPARPLRLC